MSTGLYHVSCVRGYEYVRTAYQDGQVMFTTCQESRTFRCEVCGSRDVQPRAGLSGGSSLCPSVAGQRSLFSLFRASPARPVDWSARWASASLTRGGPAPMPSSVTPWSCSGI